MTDLAPFQGVPEVFPREGTLLLRVPSGALDLPGQPIRLPEGEFRPKDELHVTLVGRALGARLRKAGLRPEQMERLAAGRDWTVRPTREYWLVQAPDEPGREAPRQSIVQLIDVPDLEPFLAELAQTAGITLPDPAPHLTWYTRNGGQGVGLGSDEVFRERRVRRLGAGSLAGYRSR